MDRRRLGNADPSAATDGTPPRDHYSLCYVIHFIVGAGVLLPWNVYITAVDYFYSLYPECHVAKTFSVAYMASSLFMLLLITTTANCSSRPSVRLRVNAGLLLFVCSLLVPLLMRTGMGWGGAKHTTNTNYFGVTIAAVAVCGLSEGLAGGSFVGSAGRLPKKYMQAVFVGTASSGIIVSILRIITKASLPQNTQGLKKSARLYFIVSLIFMLGCIACYNVLNRLPLMRYYNNTLIIRSPAASDRCTSSSTAAAACSTTCHIDHLNNINNGSSDATAYSNIILHDVEDRREPPASAVNVMCAQRSTDHPSSSLDVDEVDHVSPININAPQFCNVWKRIRWPALAITAIYIVTLSIFPGYITEDVKSKLLKDWYPILLITLYNVSDLVGKSLTALYIPNEAATYMVNWACAARVALYPLFAACLHGPTIFRTEVPVMVLTCALGFTNGYLTSALMILAPKLVDVAQAETAGTVMALFLSAGLLGGSALGWVWVI